MLKIRTFWRVRCPQKGSFIALVEKGVVCEVVALGVLDVNNP
jgi:energy-converting hydrogenase Eha subunit C